MGATVLSFNEFVRLDATSCCVCGVTFAVPAQLLQRRRIDHHAIWCPNGHELAFQDSEDARLRRELEREKAARVRAEELRAAALKRADHDRIEMKKAKTRLRNVQERVKNGVCPCCHRSFVQLARHMATKHPGYAADGSKGK